VRLSPGRALAFELHYHAHDPSSGAFTATADRTKVDLELASGPVERTAELVTVGLPNVVVPPLARGHVRSGTIALDEAGDLLAIEPRMHTLGRTIRASLVGGRAPACLVDVPRWDHHWEDLFLLAAPVPLAGKGIELSCSWDNLTSSVVTGGREIDDEECAVDLLVTRAAP
jgi:hypothetical protein